MAKREPVIFATPSKVVTYDARFRAKVDRRGPAECWPWKGAQQGKGYGLFWYFGRNVKAHRYAYVTAEGNGPVAGLVVRHKCDNPPCCNPEHLELGTQGDNVRDRVERGRCARGERMGVAVLTNAEVATARRRVRAGETIAAVADSLGHKHDTINAAVRGRRWGYTLTGEAPVPGTYGRLTPELVATARRRVRAGETITAVADSLGHRADTTRLAVRGCTWRGPVLGEAPVPGTTYNAQHKGRGHHAR